MVESKYNYDEALQLLQEASETKKEIPRDELVKVLIGKPAESKKEFARFSSALSNLKARKLKKLNIELVPVHDVLNKNKITAYSAVKKESKTSKVYEYKNENFDCMGALQKSNQKLFLEKENLAEEVNRLRVDLEVMKAREIEYKKIINSFYSLAMVY